MLNLKTRRTPKIKTEELYVFANHLATLIDAGVPLRTTLNILAEQTEKQDFKNVVERIVADIDEGRNLTLALSRFPKIFSNLFISLVQAGEKSGNMSKVLQQLSDYLKAQNAIEKKVKSAVAYPKFVVSFFLLVVLAIIFGLIPKFKAIFASFHAELPLPTRVLIGISEFAIDNWLIETSVIFGSIILIKKYKNRKSVQVFLDKLTLGMPFMGDLLLKSLLSKFCRTLSLLLKSGLTLVESLEIAGKISNNSLFRHALQSVMSGVTEGKRIHHLMRQFQIFPVLMVQMISVGESSGSLDQMLEKVSEIYDSHVDSKISALASIIEPALMVGLGAVALVVIIALYLPIFNMSGAIQ